MRSASNMDRMLKIEAGAYYDCVMPEDVEALWGPVPLRRLPEGQENKCKAVTHGILDSTGQKLFSVYLVHSLPLEMSVVQLFVRDKMAVVGHLVGKETVNVKHSHFARDVSNVFHF